MIGVELSLLGQSRWTVAIMNVRLFNPWEVRFTRNPYESSEESHYAYASLRTCIMYTEKVFDHDPSYSVADGSNG